MFHLTVEIVIAIHDDVLNPGEVPSLALDKSLVGALGRVENRLAYGLIEDVFDLAASYAMSIAQGHCFNDGIKPTAYRSMEVGQIIIRVAQGLMDEGALAEWLRGR